MPAKSKAQYRFMKAVKSGSIKAPGLSKKEALEYTKSNKNYKGLVEKVAKKRKKNVSSRRTYTK